MGEFRKPEIDKKDFVNSKLYNDLMGDKFTARSYKYEADVNIDLFYIRAWSADEIFEIGLYLYDDITQRDNDAFQLRLMSCPLFEEL